MTDLYPNLIVRYVYEETNDILGSGVKHLLKNDSGLKRLYEQLKESRNLIEQNVRMLHPQKSLVENILHYAVQKNNQG